jgi:hypothetical protein
MLRVANFSLMEQYFFGNEWVFKTFVPLEKLATSCFLFQKMMSSQQKILLQHKDDNNHTSAQEV